MKTKKPLQITIIGGGFCGTMTAIHLMQNRTGALHIHLINKGNPIAKGVAFNPHTASLLLNVPSGRMSAYPDIPDHFVQWIKTNPGLEQMDDEELAHSFSTREQYGYYLTHVWREALDNKGRDVIVSTYDDQAYDMVEDAGLYHIYLRNHPMLTADVVILATGNVEPRLPSGIPAAFGSSKHYFNNPWKRGCIENFDPQKDILIIGNGLTMADTVIGLIENGFDRNIHTVSPHGFNLNPFKDTKPQYTAVNNQELLSGKIELRKLLKTLNEHRKIAEANNESVYHMIDSLRPDNQKIWQAISKDEKLQFMKYLRHLWGSIRHRLPLKMHSFIADMYAQQRLHTYKGRVTAINETDGMVEVTLNCGGTIKTLKVQRIINCTGPESNLKLSANELLRNLEKNGVICSDSMNIAINADPANGAVLTAGGDCKPNLFVIGSNLKGVLWESTAVPELRLQAKKLAAHLVERYCSEVFSEQDA